MIRNGDRRLQSWAMRISSIRRSRSSGLRSSRRCSARAAGARRNGRLWTGRFVMEAQITHILVVTDCARRDPRRQWSIDAELKR